MIYVMSDIHGRIDLFNAMLDQINLQEGDKLYVLGDCIDRGGGLKVMEKIMQLNKRGLCELILGNHEYIFWYGHQKHVENSVIEKYQKEVNKRVLKNRKSENDKPSATVFEAINRFKSKLTELTESIENSKRICDLQNKIMTSLKLTKECGNVDEWESYADLDNMSSEKKNELFEFIGQCDFQKYIEVDGKKYLLVHAGIKKTIGSRLFERESFYLNPVGKKTLRECGYDENTTVIFGHTTTRDINIYKNNQYISPCKIWHDTENNDKIGIDCGASFPNGQLGCLRLDDMKEFYVRNEDKFITPIEKIDKVFKVFYGDLENE